MCCRVFTFLFFFFCPCASRCRFLVRSLTVPSWTWRFCPLWSEPQPSTPAEPWNPSFLSTRTCILLKSEPKGFKSNASMFKCGEEVSMLSVGRCVFLHCHPLYQACGFGQRCGLCVSPLASVQERKRNEQVGVCTTSSCRSNGSLSGRSPAVNTSMILPSACKWGSRAQTRVDTCTLLSRALPPTSTRASWGNNRMHVNRREVTTFPAGATWARDSSLEFLLSST